MLLAASLAIWAGCAWGTLPALLAGTGIAITQRPLVNAYAASVDIAFVRRICKPTRQASRASRAGGFRQPPTPAHARCTLLYLHGQNGNLGDTVTTWLRCTIWA